MFNGYEKTIKDLLNVFQSANLLKNGIKDILPNFTHYADYDKLDNVLKDLTIDFSNWNGKKAKYVLDIISKKSLYSSTIELLDVMYFGPQEFDIAESTVVPGVDLTNILIIFGDLDRKSSIYTVIFDDNFLKNMKCIPGIGIAYNKDEVLNIFKKYITLIN